MRHRQEGASFRQNPITRPYRRMAVTLARVTNGDTDAARAIAVAAADKIKLSYGPET
ncbi:hypothetical protein [Sphingorhabdus sp.]|uniref:hypothetical protein n=1 Tax=Sphingorhabdus sp. TaxID=1902408 RepID=UPI0039832DB3